MIEEEPMLTWKYVDGKHVATCNGKYVNTIYQHRCGSWCFDPLGSDDSDGDPSIIGRNVDWLKLCVEGDWHRARLRAKERFGL